METTKITGVDKPVSRIGLGTWAIGGWMWGGTDEAESVKTVRAAMDRGVNLIDTAPIYGFGKSEELVAKAIAEHGNRDELVISTKFGIEWHGEKEVYRNATPERMRKEVEDSLRRLGVEHIDVYFVHWPDPLVPFEKTAEAMEKLREEGKIKAIGVSNYSSDQLEQFRKGGRADVTQPPYNLFEREIEDDLLPYCNKHEVAIMAYGGLCRGLLSGKMSMSREFTGDDLRQMDPKFKHPRFKAYLAAVEQLDNLAKERHDRTVLELAIRWILDHGAQMVLWGARRPDQVENIDRVMDWSLTVGDLREIDRIVEENITDPVGPEFMAPPSREAAQA